MLQSILTYGIPPVLDTGFEKGRSVFYNMPPLENNHMFSLFFPVFHTI